MKKNVLALFGGRSTEHDISVITAIEALYAMPDEYNVLPVYMRDGKFYGGKELYTLKNYAPFVPQNHVELVFCGDTVCKRGIFGRIKPIFKPDCALLLNHGGEGENGSLQGFLDILGIPYTSTSVFGSAMAMDKYAVKTRLNAVGVRVVPGCLIRSGYDQTRISELESRIGYPMFVKPNSQGSSIGIGVARDRSELIAKLEVAFEYDKEALVEECLSGFTELNVACRSVNGVLETSAPERPLSSEEALTFEDKYIVGAKGGSGMEGCKREFPADVDEAIKSELCLLTRKIYDELKLFGVIRADFMLVDDKIYFNEVNTIPGSLAHYLYPDVSYGEFLSEAIKEGMRRSPKKVPTFFSSVLTQGVGKSRRSI